MVERPILFQGAMVRALLAGTKTQTRRILKHTPPEHTVVVGRWHGPEDRDAYWAFVREGAADPNHPFGGCEIQGINGALPIFCPYGQPGDRLWVREAFSGPWHQEGYAPGLWHSMDEIWYWADGNPTSGDWTRPRPSIHMPRWASRLTLEITAVRVERLQDISRGDAMAEGCPFPNMADGADPRQWYAALWDEINGADAWDANPWVWVVEFRRVADQGSSNG